jgi:hypothetical protein
VPVNARILSGLLIIVALLLSARAQGNMTIEHQPEKARHLAGVVTDTAGQPFSGAIVEDCDSGFKQVLRSTTTDINGKFSFSSATHGSEHYLNVRYPNMDFDHRIVTISVFARSRLKIELHPGT